MLMYQTHQTSSNDFEHIAPILRMKCSPGLSEMASDSQTFWGAWRPAMRDTGNRDTVNVTRHNYNNQQIFQPPHGSDLLRPPKNSDFFSLPQQSTETPSIAVLLPKEGHLANLSHRQHQHSLAQRQFPQQDRRTVEDMNSFVQPPGPMLGDQFAHFVGDPEPTLYNTIEDHEGQRELHMYEIRNESEMQYHEGGQYLAPQSYVYQPSLDQPRYDYGISECEALQPTIIDVQAGTTDSMLLGNHHHSNNEYFQPEVDIAFSHHSLASNEMQWQSWQHYMPDTYFQPEEQALQLREGDPDVRWHTPIDSRHHQIGPSEPSSAISPKTLTLDLSSTAYPYSGSVQGSDFSQTASYVPSNADDETEPSAQEASLAERKQAEDQTRRRKLPDAPHPLRKAESVPHRNDAGPASRPEIKTLLTVKSRKVNRSNPTSASAIKTPSSRVPQKSKTKAFHKMIPPKRIEPKQPASTEVKERSCRRSSHQSADAVQPRSEKDDFLVANRNQGVAYKDIRRRGEFTEAESTLRGRYRTLTKVPSARVRKPEWDDNDILLLKRAVRKYTSGSENSECKIPWKKIADYIANNGGSYHFGNATCRKRWDELVDIHGTSQKTRKTPSRK